VAEIHDGFRQHLATFNQHQVAFQNAAEAYKPGERRFRELRDRHHRVSAFAVEPTSPITTSVDKVSFELRGGVPPQRFVRGPADVEVNMVVISSTVTHVEVKVTDFAAAKGPWDIVFYDGSTNPAPLTVRIQKPPAPAP
jgi:hypothetical protein